MAVSITNQSQQILMPNIPLPANTDKFTFMCYALPSANNVNSQICGQTNGTGTNNVDFQFTTVSNTNKFGAEIRIGNTTTALTTNNNAYTPNTDSSNGNRYHLCLTYDGTIVRFYVNGVSVRTSSRTGFVQSTSNRLFCISGVPNNSTTQEFLGVVEDIRIYNKAFTQQEISLVLSARGRDGLYDNIIAWYRLNELASGTIATSVQNSVKDYGPNKYDGKTNGSSPSWVRPHVFFTKKKINMAAR